ncbi:S24 family peptidase [Providencia manganoxydans]|uniref:S24 family peptidase n=1 Tax=Providencia manganoxydans TaxID=2923283 RepID=UPI003F6F4D03
MKHPSGTYFLRVSGTSMIDAQIFDGDIVIVDSGLRTYPKRILFQTMMAQARCSIAS